MLSLDTESSHRIIKVELRLTMRNLRVAIVQRVFASYRKPFLQRLGSSDGLTLSLYAGQPRRKEGIRTVMDCDGVAVHRGRNIHFAGVVYQVDTVSWLEGFNPDVVVLEANPRIISHWRIIRWGERRGVPIVGWGLGQLKRDIGRIRSYGRNAIFRILVRRFAGAVSYSTKAAGDYARYGLPQNRIFVALNAIDDTEVRSYVELLRRENGWVEKWRSANGIRPGTPTALFVGRLTRRKQIDLLIDACSRLTNVCQLVIVGDGPYRRELEDLAARHQSHVTFLGHLEGIDLARAFLASDFFVLPGLGGLSIHHALCYGKPIVVSEGDGTEADYVSNGVNGLVFRTGDVHDLQEKVAYLSVNPQVRKDMACRSSEKADYQVNMEVMLGAFRDALMTCSDRRSETCAR